MAGYDGNCPAVSSTSPSPSRAEVVIVGAGFAGLSAAKVLTAFGVKPVVVEARERIGGRAHTLEFPALPESGLEACPLEGGCNYLHGCGEDHPMFLLAHRLGLPTAICAADLGGRFGGWESCEVANWYDSERQGERLSEDEVVEAFLLLQQTLHGVSCLDQRVCSEREAAPRDLHTVFEEALAQVLQRRHKAGGRAEASLTLRERGLLYSMRGRHYGFVSPFRRMPTQVVAESMAQDDSEEIFSSPSWPSTCPEMCKGLKRTFAKKKQLVREWLPASGVAVVEDPEDPGEDRLLLGRGFKGIIDFLADGQEVLLGDPVRSVDQSNGEVRFTFASGRELIVPYAVISTPCGVLAGLDERSAISFVPPLPDEKRAAIRRLSIPALGACTHEKVVLRWPLDSSFVTKVLGAPEAPMQICTTDVRFHFLNLHKFGRSGQLLCHIWADAEWSEHKDLSDPEVVDTVVAALRAIFPGPATNESGDDVPEVTDPVQSHVTRWAEDPFALGAYSELQDPQGSEKDRVIYARPEGRLLFAGEGTAPGMVGAQCVHGALLSGVAAALDLLETMRKQSREGNAADGLPAGVSVASISTALLCDRYGPLGLDVEAVVDLLVDPGNFFGRSISAACQKRQPPKRPREDESTDSSADCR